MSELATISTRATSPVSKKLNQMLTTYASAAGAAGVSLLAIVQPAEAKVVYTPAHLSLGGNIFIDLNHDGVFDIGIRPYGFCISEQVGSLCGASNNINYSSYKLGKFLGAPGFTPALFAGAKISPSAQFSARQVIASNWYQFFSGTIKPPTWFGPFANGGKGVRDRYIGFKFSIGPQPHYGWLRVTVQIKNPQQHGYSAFITGYAYETEANKGIVAGQTTGADEKSELLPEALVPKGAPAATLGLLARGSDALAIWRRDDEVAAQ